MAQSTKDIKRRIQGIGSIMQITNAMELVASAKLRKSRERLEITKPYFETVFENINDILAATSANSSLMEKREVKNRAVILVSSDKGLAGGYNINAVNKALEYVKNSDAENTVIYTTGIRSIELLKRKGFDVNKDFTHIDNDPIIEDASAMGSFFANKYIEKVYDEVVIVYTKFDSMVSFVPKIIKLLPATGFEAEGKKSIKKFDFDFEPSVSTVLTQMIKQYVNVTIYGCLLESSASEQASRRTAMENATSNGEDLLENLQLEFNRARQASITQEISEIVGGANALN
ncbi:ATP synthase F1 subunit gamma [Helcococcus ovis]|uniref:ATP synthase gamma chain n=1 Tax=Helcococcus ovis TaxID=72026 RepID=A0A4R9C121_9FIRM|nr:ATP synthase F1 subunit gamma [Helcococcus ovis]TFF64817.1 ATP synthase F1 subunit gamma [Helcococcus ovis]TFF65863.1 ATP synthase F1 subunit gamma [Helcococcus ovis]TFF67801.1 ATP synthase F1 subunit gamma [Helcococcus ovis]WNZ01065.1 ATP synthase F1 subunit gamma [Helcococcus ovis]